jgi:outer membrane protein OmpA-like peptidoglycan-associated protein
MLRDMEALVRKAAEAFGAQAGFSGFSEASRQQLDRLSRIDWSRATFGINGGDEQDKFLAIYYYIRVQRDELEKLLRDDIAGLAGVDLLAPAPADPGTSLEVASICGTVFDEDRYLCALDLTLADTGGGGIEPALGRDLLLAIEERRAEEHTAAPPAYKPRKRDRWLKAELDRINERIDRTDQRRELWVLRDRLDDIDARMDDMQLELQEVKHGGRANDDNPIANLSALTGRNITVRFARNAVTLDAEYRVLLNEVFEQLARNPGDRVLITGYTDRSGDPAVNLRLSEQRAKAVRDYLLRRGIAPERLLVNYYGDSRSLGRNPDERRVEVEWLR